MNNLVPHNFELPATVENPGRPYQPQRPSLRFVIGVILSRAWRAIAVGAALFLLVIGFFAQVPRTYYAEGSVLIQPRRENLTRVQQADWVQTPDTSAIDTEVEVLRSRALAEDVVKNLKLYEDPEFNSGIVIEEPIRFAWDWPVSFELELPFSWASLSPFGSEEEVDYADNSVFLDQTITEVQRHAYVRRVGLTYVVRIGFASHDPEKARIVTDEFMSAYLDRQLNDKVNAAERANTELDGSIGKLRQAALDTESKAQEYKNVNRLLSVEGATLAESEVSNLNRQIAEARADRAEKEARVAAAVAQVRRGGGGADVGAALVSDTIRELRTREAENSVQLAQLTVRFKDDYPEVKKVQAQLNDVRAQIQREINRIISNLRAEAGAAAEREASLMGSRGQAERGLVSNNRARVGLLALEQRAEAAKKIYEGYLNRASEVAVERSLQQADAVINYQAAIAPTFSPNSRTILAFAGLLALLGAAATVLVSEFWSRRLRSRSDIEQEIGIPMAGALPDVGSIGGLSRRRYPAGPADHLVEHPFTAFAEAFRNLRAFLMLSARSGPSKVIAITSSVPREGKTITSLCLARTLALSGAKVVLVDCDLRRRGVTKAIGGSDVGIVEVVEEKYPIQRVLIRDTRSNAWILPASGQRDVPHDLFSKPEADELLRNLAEAFDYVILDTPPLLGVADARILAAKADRVLYVVQWNKTPTSAAQSAIEILQECGANVAGVILSKVNVKQQARYGYGDSSDYFNYYRHYYLPAS